MKQSHLKNYLAGSYNFTAESLRKNIFGNNKFIIQLQIISFKTLSYAINISMHIVTE